MNRPEYTEATREQERAEIAAAAVDDAALPDRPSSEHLAAAEYETRAAEPAADISEQIADQAAAETAAAPEPAIEFPRSDDIRATDAAPAGDEPAAEPRVSKTSSILLPAVTGAVAAALVVGAAWSVLLPSATLLSGATAPASTARPDNAALDALAARVASIEARPAPAAAAAADAAAPTADLAIGLRIDVLEKSVAALRDDLAAARGQSEQLTGAINALKAAPVDSTASASTLAPTASASSDPSPDLAAITDRLAALERAAKTPEPAASAEPPRAVLAADDTPLRRVVAATLLDVSVRQGEPFSVLLETAKPLATDPASLKSLETFAATGVPGPAALSRELVALLPKLLPPAESSTAAGFVDRFQASAERLVRLQRTDAIAGIDRTTLIGRLSAAAQRNDVAELRRELGALTPAERAPVQAWIDKAAARDQALAASRQFAAAALAALPKTSP